MFLRSSSFISVLLAAIAAGAQPVYKCQESGTITYTDRPCSPEAEPAVLPGLVVTAPPGAAQRNLAQARDARIARETAERDRADAEWLKQHHNRRDREARVRQAIIEHRVIKSMTADEVKLALGEPDQVDRGESYGTDKETWTYLQDGARRTVNFKDGQVTTTSRKGKRAR
jgi:hypothetical protein